MAEPPIISWDRVDELRDEVGADDFAEIVDLFLVETDATLAELRGTVDPASAEALMHALKGSALNLGFDAVADLCREGRATAAMGGDWQGAVDRLAGTYAASRAALLERL